MDNPLKTQWYNLLDPDGRPKRKQLTEAHLAQLLAQGYALAPKPEKRTTAITGRDLRTKGLDDAAAVESPAEVSGGAGGGKAVE